MIYVPILKTRREEYRIAKQMKNCFSDKLIPMFEIIAEKYAERYMIDSATGDFMYEKKGKKRQKIKIKESSEDIITLKYINDLLDNKRMFIDYFRFSVEKYGQQIDVSKVDLALKLNNNYALYKKKVLSVSEFPNMIPVISVKEGFDIPKSELRDFMDEVQHGSSSMALRITEKWIEPYADLIKYKLRGEDYLLFDIEEQNPESKFMEIEEIIDIASDAQIILVNSPRKASVRNGEYPEHDKTSLINNSARFVAESNDFAGYGDYCGLKDQMPMQGGSNGMGAALALFYDFNKNIFYAYSNHDTSLGIRGYYDLIPLIKADEDVLNYAKDCPAFKMVETLESCGNWSTWHHINAVRYIYQTYKYLPDQ